MTIHRHIWEIKRIQLADRLNAYGQESGFVWTYLSCVCQKCGKVKQVKLDGHFEFKDFKLDDKTKARIYVP